MEKTVTVVNEPFDLVQYTIDISKMSPEEISGEYMKLLAEELNELQMLTLKHEMSRRYFRLINAKA